MHEMSIAVNVVEIVAEYARTHNARRVVRVAVEVGGLSGIVPDALAFSYDVAARGTVAEGSRLDIRPVAVLAVCADCGHSFAPDYHLFVCPRCESLSTRLVAGEELAVVEMEIDDEKE
jgi:hydrogenase nickel incorporation protein HypA/HybF